MEPLRQSWTDDRLDDFRVEVGQRFDAIDRKFDAIDRKFEAVDRKFEVVDQRFEGMDERLARVDTDLRELRGEIHAMQRTMVQIGGSMMITFVIGFAGLIAAQL